MIDSHKMENISPPTSDKGGNAISAELERGITVISRQLRKRLGLALFGYDLIIGGESSAHKGQYFVIDINHFPSYEGVDRFPQRLVNFLVAKHASKKRKIESLTRIN